MEKRVSKIVSIVLTIGLCGIIVRADFLKIGAGARWAAKKARSGWRATKSAAAKSFGTIKKYWDDFKESNSELAFMLLSAAAQDAVVSILKKTLSSEKQSYIDSGVTQDEQGRLRSYLVRRHIKVYPGGLTEGHIRMIVGVVIPIFIQIMWTEGWRFKGQIFSRVAIKLLLGRALDKAAEKLIGEGQVNRLMYEVLKDQAAALISETTVEQLLFKGYKSKVADESMVPLLTKDQQ